MFATVVFAQASSLAAALPREEAHSSKPFTLDKSKLNSGDKLQWCDLTETKPRPERGFSHHRRLLSYGCSIIWAGTMLVDNFAADQCLNVEQIALSSERLYLRVSPVKRTKIVHTSAN